MSRSYRVAIRENLRRVLKAKDGITSQLEILEILPGEQMADLLATELERRGFRDEDGLLVREKDGVKVTVDPCSGTVTVSAEGDKEVTLAKDKVGHAWDDVGPSAKAVREQLRDQAKKDLERDAEKETAKLQGEVSDRLEGQLAEIRRELDDAVNRVTAEALKQKARSLGEIKEMSEDPQTGSLTIVVEV